MKKSYKFNLFIENLIKSYSMKKISFIHCNFHGLEQILEELYFIGIVGGFIKKSNNYFEILLKYSAFGQQMLFQKNYYYKQSIKKTIRIRQIKSIMFVNAFSQLFILTAKEGIILQKRALALRSGGFFLSKIQ